MTQYQFLNMGYGQYFIGFTAGNMGYLPHAKDWMPAELYPYVSRSTLIVKNDTKGKEGTYEKRIDRLPVYRFTVGDTLGGDVTHRRSRSPARSTHP
jgi:hypothetical protein